MDVRRIDVAHIHRRGALVMRHPSSLCLAPTSSPSTASQCNRIVLRRDPSGMADLSPYADERGLIRLGRIRDAGHRSVVRTMCLEGSLIRLSRGHYLDSALWRSLDADERYRARIHAATGACPLASEEQLCGPSALAMWRLPALDGWPDGVHTVEPKRGRGRRSGILIRYVTSRVTAAASIDGLAVTTLARAVADAAATGSLAAGLLAADAALRGTTCNGWRRAPLPRAELLDEIVGRADREGRARAHLAAQLADPRAESPGESLLRASIHLLGLPMPELQWEFRGDSGRRYVVDFYWPDQDFVLEFDGRAKYLDASLRGGRSAEQVVLDEKEREDELRARVRGMARVGWAISRSPARLEARLRSAGFCFPPGHRS